MLRPDVEVVMVLLAFRDELKDVGAFADLWLGLEACADGLEDVVASDHAPVGDVVDG